MITTGEMRVGWAKVGSRPGVGLGVDATSYAFDGCHVGGSVVLFGVV